MPRLQLNDSDDDVPTHRSAASFANKAHNSNHSNNNNNNNHHEQKKRYFLKPPTEEDKEKQRELAAKNTKHALKAITTDDGTDMPVKENTKVFVDGLPFQEPPQGQASISDQLTAFCTAWKVGKVVYVSKKPGQGFAYVAFRSPNSVDVAINVLNGKRFMGRALKVELPKNISKYSVAGKDDAAGGNPNKNLEYEKLPSRPASAASLNDAESYTKQVLLSDLPPHAQPDILRELFTQYCPALEPYVTKIKMTSRNRKAFVTFEEEAQAKELAEFLNGFTLLGRRIEAQMAQPPGVAQWSPFQIAQMKKEQLLKAVQQDAAEKGKTVPAGWGGGGASATAAAAAKKTTENEESVEDRKQKQRELQQKKNLEIKSSSDQSDLVGGNAHKKFPMPVLIDKSLDEQIDDRRRKRPDDDDDNDNDESSSKPKNSANNSNKLATKLQQHQQKQRFARDGATTLYVANIPEDVTEARLRKHFSTVGGIIRKCNLSASAAGGGTSNGLAVVEYGLPADAEVAVKKLDGSLLGGQKISVELDGEGKVGTYGYQAEDEDVIAAMKKKQNELDEDEEDAFARFYGVKDRKKFLKKYSKGGDDDEDEDDDEDGEDFGGDDDDDDMEENSGNKKGKKGSNLKKKAMVSGKKKAGKK